MNKTFNCSSKEWTDGFFPPYPMVALNYEGHGEGIAQPAGMMRRSVIEWWCAAPPSWSGRKLWARRAVSWSARKG